METTKVLLVEDNLGDARLIYEGLQEALPNQFQMTHVRRLSEALEYLWEETCNVVLLDLGLPDSHGLDTLVVTRAQAPWVPIVVLTGLQDEATAVEALKSGAQDYLVKGQADSKQLGRCLHYAIVRKATEEALLRQSVTLANVEELRRSRQRLLSVQENVRRDVSSHLNDDVREELLTLRRRLQELPKIGGSEGETDRLLSQATEQLAALSGRLYPSCLSQGLVPAFLSFADRFKSGAAVAVELGEELVRREKAAANFVPEQAKLALYRIAEEALTNAIQHAKAAKITVRLDAAGEDREDWLRLTVRDDGQGFDAHSVPAKRGLAIMQDYADAAGGQCAISSTPGSGTEVTVMLHLSQLVADPPLALAKGDH